ncbi:MAG: hypothetical protein QM703_14170 [Gemmatales bacterium]
MLTKEFIVVRQPDKSFVDSTSLLGRAMPAKGVVLGMLKTPDLVPSEMTPLRADLDTSKITQKEIDNCNGQIVYIPRPLDTKNFDPLRWPLTFTDESKRQMKIDNACLLFASNVILGQRVWDAVQDKYRSWDVKNQPFALTSEVPAIKLTDLSAMPVPIVGAKVKPKPAPQVAEGSVPQFVLEFASIEQAAASRLGEAIQALQSIQISPPKVEDIPKYIAELCRDVLNQLTRGRAALLRHLAFVLGIKQQLEKQWKGTAKKWQDELEAKLRKVDGQVDATMAQFWTTANSFADEWVEPIKTLQDRVTATVKEVESSLQKDPGTNLEGAGSCTGSNRFSS